MRKAVGLDFPGRRNRSFLQTSGRRGRASRSRADQVPSEKNLMDDPNEPINRENAALDRMVKGIFRGC
jgi:hypothetical protein